MTYACPPQLAYVAVEPRGGEELQVYLLQLPDGAPRVLAGTSALIWLLAVEGEDVVNGIAAATGQRTAAVEDAVGAYVKQLLTQGLLEVTHQTED